MIDPAKVYLEGYDQAMDDLTRSVPELVHEICEAALASGYTILERRLSQAQVAHKNEGEDGS